MELLPARWIAVGVAASVPLVVLGQAIALIPFGSSLEDLPRLWFNAMLFALPAALVFGVPMALSRLRGREAGDFAWGFSGLLAGVASGIVLVIGFALFTHVSQLLPHFLFGTALLLAFTSSAGLLSALLTRRIAWALADRFA